MADGKSEMVEDSKQNSLGKSKYDIYLEKLEKYRETKKSLKAFTPANKLAPTPGGSTSTKKLGRSTSFANNVQRSASVKLVRSKSCVKRPPTGASDVPIKKSRPVSPSHQLGAPPKKIQKENKIKRTESFRSPSMQARLDEWKKKKEQNAGNPTTLPKSGSTLKRQTTFRATPQTGVTPKPRPPLGITPRTTPALRRSPRTNTKTSFSVEENSHVLFPKSAQKTVGIKRSSSFTVNPRRNTLAPCNLIKPGLSQSKTVNSRAPLPPKTNSTGKTPVSSLKRSSTFSVSSKSTSVINTKTEISEKISDTLSESQKRRQSVLPPTASQRRQSVLPPTASLRRQSVLPPTANSRRQSVLPSSKNQGKQSVISSSGNALQRRQSLLPPGGNQRRQSIAPSNSSIKRATSFTGNTSNKYSASVKQKSGDQPLRQLVVPPVKRSSSFNVKSSASSPFSAKKTFSKANLHNFNETSSRKTELRRRSYEIKRKDSDKPTKAKARKSILKLPVLEEGKDGTDGTDIMEPRQVQHVQFSTPKSQTPVAKVKTPCKTPLRPQKEMSMREKLGAWMQAKGKTPTRYRHLCCFGEHLSAKNNTPAGVKGGLSTSELTHQQEKLASDELVSEPESVLDVNDEDSPLRSMLLECLTLFDAGCPLDNIESWLNEIEVKYPDAKAVSTYWICRARIAEEQEDDNAAVNMYEQAVIHSARPAEEIATALKEYVIRMEDQKKAKAQAANTPWKPLPRDVQQENVFQSSTVKYCITETTPFLTKVKSKRDRRSTPQTVLTPVRRSTRRSCASLPKMLQDHDKIVESLEDLPPANKENALFQPNKALEQEFEEEADV